MSKSIEDYRNIIKILKLQLLKIREENASLSHTLGIATESETSSFTPKITHYKESNQPFAKHILTFLLFAHRCEIIGITPEMVFRIADKKRDKTVGAKSFAEILKRVKLRMTQVEINQLISHIKSDNDIHYDEYLQILSAFQVNAEKYPPKGSRTYVQLSLLKFGQEAKQYKDADTLYLKMNKQDKPYLTYETYTDFVKRNMPNLQDNELIAVFVGLDMMSQCQIQKAIFKRQVGKVYSLLQRGVNIEEELSAISQHKKGASKAKPVKGKKQDDDDFKMEEQTGQEAVGKRKAPQKAAVNKKADDQDGFQQEEGQQALGKKKATSKTATDKKNKDFDMQEQEGDQAGVKKKAPAKTGEKQIKLDPGNSKKFTDQLKKLGIRISDFLQTMLNQQSKKSLVKSFTVFDFSNAAKSIKKDFPKKKMLQLFKELDTQRNGTIDTAQLIKLWIRVKEVNANDQLIYRLLSRHLRQIQYAEPSQRFQVLGISVSENLTEESFKKLFQQLQLQDLEVQKIMASYLGTNIPNQKFIQKLRSEGKPASAKKFTKMDTNTYNQFKTLIKKINDKRNTGKDKRWRKLMRVQQTGEKSTAEDYWDTIFTDEWACWEYCLQAASKLETFWRDPEFGPSKSDPTGMRSIIGNESNPPPGLPQQSQIQWITFQQLLQRKKSDEKVVFMEEKLNANHVVQGTIGDCWYVSSLSIIAANEVYIKGMPVEKCKKEQQCATYGIHPYLFKFFTKFGIYVFKYFKKFQPVYVVVDDLFPTQVSMSQLLFAKSPNAGMQWVAFLEKSYAKLHHAYSNMISGDIAQGLNDLTNSLPIKQNIEKANLAQNLQKIKRLNEQNELMGCSISSQGTGVEEPVTLNDQKCGLFYGHAYSILDFLDLNTSDSKHFDLIRVRNPWGHGEWILDWSDTPMDNNPQYQKLKQYQIDIDKHYQVKKIQAKKKGRIVPDPYKPGDDGEFLMNFQDFNSLYTNLFTGFTIENFYARYQGKKISERWDPKTPSGTCKLKGAPQKDRIDFVKNNHQYILQVTKDDTDILMYIIQQDGRLYRGEKYPYKELCNPAAILSFTLGNDKELTKFEEDKLTVKMLTFERRREVNLWNKFKKGRYAIVPCKMKNNIKETDFQFRVYSEKDKPITVTKVRGTQFKSITSIDTVDIQKGSYDSFIDLIEKATKKA